MTTLTIDELFTPATQPEWLATDLSNADRLGLATTSWHSGSDARTILTAMSFAQNFTDAQVSAIAQAGFLDFAATGTITYTTPNEDGTSTTVTVPVSPDPSIPGQNPTGASTWLDVLADQEYDVQRVQATTAGGLQAVVNVSAATYGPFAALTYHVADPVNRATYSNASALTIVPSTVVGTVASAVASGALVLIGTTAAHGRTTGDVVAVVGALGVPALVGTTGWVVTVTDATHFTLDGSTFSGTYVSGGVVYLPTVAPFAADAVGAASNSVDASGVVAANTVTQTVTSLVGVTTANVAPFAGSDVEGNVAMAARCRLRLQSLSPNGPAGIYEYVALTGVQLAPTLSPPAVLSQAVTRTIALVDVLSGLVAVVVANALGPVSALDLVVLGRLFQRFAVPLGTPAVALNSTSSPITVVFDVWVPAALNTAATSARFATAVQAYVATIPIGGFTDPGGAYTNAVLFDALLGVISTAGAALSLPVQQVQLTLDGGVVDVTLGTHEVATLSPAIPVINLHSV